MHRWLVCISILLVGALAHALTQPPATPPGPQRPGPFTDSTEIPDTPAYQRALEVLALVNDPDAAKIAAYVGESFAQKFRDDFPMDEHVSEFQRMHDGSGKLEKHSARSYDPPRPPTHAVLVCRNTLAESWQAIVVEIEEDPPHLIRSLNFAPARPPAGQGGGSGGARLEAAQIAEQLGAYVDRLSAADVFSGTLLFAKDGKPLVTRAVGIANRDFDAPINLETCFNLGSMNKMMTGVACMQLVEQARLSLDDPISKYLSEDWLPQVDKSKVKIIHLLTHTSGLGSYFTPEWDKSSRALYRRVDDYREVVKGETLAFEPGTRWRYSNTGMLIAGAVIEKASGMDYYDYIAANVTGPAGMTRSGFFSLDEVNPNLAVGYEKVRRDGKKSYRNNLYSHVIRGGPAGGGYSTVGDLLRFDQALRSGKLLKKESLEVLWSAHPEVSSPEYGLGFGVDIGPVGKVVGHGGGFDGISANLSMFLDEGYTVAVLSNYGGAAEMVAQRARELIAQGR